MAAPVLVARGLRRCGEQESRAWAMPTHTPAQLIERAARLALVCERRARWWSVLLRWVLVSDEVAWVFASATLRAIECEELQARRWRGIADSLQDQDDEHPHPYPDAELGWAS
jgi:hypothetical protein